MTANNETKIAVFGGGCFWCTEAVFEELKGVVSVVPGYAGGTTENPTYEDVKTGETGYAEVIKIEYDRSKDHFIQRPSRCFFRYTRPDHIKPPGSRRWHAVPFSYFLHNRGAEKRC
jgi:peptide-methionine (S)-S-oxide reductase